MFDAKRSGATRFSVDVPEEQLADLTRRLAQTRWPETETVTDDSQGVPLGQLQQLVAHWQTGYDWRACEARLNAFDQFRMDIDGIGIHFLHVRSPHPDALPLIMTHGWPGSILEFTKVIGPLTNPTAHGGEARDAFHLVIPSMPGFGFSDKPAAKGWTLTRIAAAWAELMQRLGYTRYVAQGGDLGAGVTTRLGKAQPQGLAAIHLNFPILSPPPLEGDPTPPEKAALEQMMRYRDRSAGYSLQQKTRPQTIGYALTDSPVGQAAWIYEKFLEWQGEDAVDGLSLDDMLDDITLYWLTGTAASSARLYWESWDTDWKATTLDILVGCSIFPGEIYRGPRVWAERMYKNLFYWNEVERSGHFAAYGSPSLFVRELRDCFRAIR